MYAETRRAIATDTNVARRTVNVSSDLICKKPGPLVRDSSGPDPTALPAPAWPHRCARPKTQAGGLRRAALQPMAVEVDPQSNPRARNGSSGDYRQPNTAKTA